jgi:HEAT repeat protein
MAGLRKKYRIGLVLVLALAAIGVVLYASRTNEPSYQGRALNQWLSDIENANDDRAAESAKNAVRHIGTNAIPYLLGMMRAEDSKLKETFNALVSKAHIYRFRIAEASDKQVRALNGFYVLGPQATPAIPELTVLLNKPKIVRFATAALIYISPNGVEAATTGLRSTNPLVRREIAGVLGTAGIVRFTTNATPARMAILRAQAEFAVPALIRLLNDSDELTRARAGTSLGFWDRSRKLLFPLLSAIWGKRMVGACRIRQRKGSVDLALMLLRHFQR